jgi:hypothetical protein
MALQARASFNPRDLSAAERRKETQYIEEECKEICPTFWPPREWDRDEDKLTERESVELREKISQSENALRVSTARRARIRARRFVSSSDGDFVFDDDVFEPAPADRLPKIVRKWKCTRRSGATAEPTADTRPPLAIAVPSCFFETESSETDLDGF